VTDAARDLGEESASSADERVPSASTAVGGWASAQLQALGDDLRVVLPPWVAARVLVALSYVLAATIARHWTGGARISSGLTAWDGAFYRVIAQSGYHAPPHAGLRFFPLYPLLARFVTVLVGGSTTTGLLLVANLASLVAAVLVRRLVIFERGDVALADRAVWVICLFPASFVLVWGYAEGVFLALAVGTFIAARHRWFAVAAACAFGASLTRPVGVLLAAPLAWEAWIYLRAQARRSLGDYVATATAVVAPVLGFGAYLLWVRQVFGDAWLPLSDQQQLRGSADPVVRIGRALIDMVGAQRTADGLHTPFVLVFLVLLVVVARRWPFSYTLFAALSLVVALSARNLNSTERYALSAFPLLFGLADITGTVWRERIALAVCGCGLLSLSALAWLQVYVP
jgi:hypothetical protein